MSVSIRRTLLAAVLLSAVGGASAYDLELNNCVNDPGAQGLLAGVATGLTGPISIPVPGRVAASYCTTVSCSATGGIDVEPSAPSFPGCEKPISITAGGTGTCSVTVTRETLLGTKTLAHQTYSYAPTGPSPFPIEACLTRTGQP